ncbi:LCP family protein [Actinoplanes derwentensis]|uniref:Anionic cell wall polymer biosynthesis enzyme, LytR-Cps2A-Psr (LCP) family n=1 Tax=Actinoplanes derwentensis TaxID=113562 RepID=A0A1H2CML0_9ACTN|nr:LCP family protein [Actinoplanes derwentensis]GID86202.1 transcriptional regulator [Actinoplanes derwentensis]SDT71765.1 Anionic cell wall polymer biosynthesis enzyme, LytR-Cps2A-Psr (LCP) family [Actinoplanes derwentensis]
MTKTVKRRAPLWARLSAIAGSVLIVTSVGALVTAQTLVAKYTAAVTDDSIFEPRAANAAVPRDRKEDDSPSIKGPLNLLLVGIDPRDDKTPPLSDSIILAHIPADMSTVYLFSLPRDLYVDIPAFPKADYRGGSGKINGSMSMGSHLGDGKYSAAQGFQLLAKTVGGYTGIKEFDAGGIVNFGGFKKIVEAMEGVTMTIDQDVKSEHLKPDGSPRDRLSRCADNTCDHPYIGVQKIYQKGTYHLQAWEALDYVRQRYGLPEGDYDRQRHQQQFVKALAKQAMSKDVVTDPAKLLKVMNAAGGSLTFSGGGHTVLDWAFALQGLNVDDMITVKLPGGGKFAGSTYLGEELEPSTKEFFQAVREDRVGGFLLDHPEYVNLQS